ncbi:hypothetical protein QBC43DRAFT_332046 [Cladorrhinum sp. PSN259]|nr:hypothetical protein QBC43DRAFT_332046 [Cladorrhinum sp. PSN259]
MCLPALHSVAESSRRAMYRRRRRHWPQPSTTARAWHISTAALREKYQGKPPPVLTHVLLGRQAPGEQYQKAPEVHLGQRRRHAMPDAPAAARGAAITTWDRQLFDGSRNPDAFSWHTVLADQPSWASQRRDGSVQYSGTPIVKFSFNSELLKRDAADGNAFNLRAVFRNIAHSTPADPFTGNQLMGSKWAAGAAAPTNGPNVMGILGGGDSQQSANGLELAMRIIGYINNALTTRRVAMLRKAVARGWAMVKTRTMAETKSIIPGQWIQTTIQ